MFYFCIILMELIGDILMHLLENIIEWHVRIIFQGKNIMQKILLAKIEKLAFFNRLKSPVEKLK